MRPWLLELAIAAVSVGAFAGLYALMLLVTRPRWITPGPAGQDLAPQSPAIASLLGNGWDLTEDAAEATLLDLGGRKFLEFRQPADDPFHTTIHVGTGARPARAGAATTPTGLNRYEQRVYDRVAGLAVGGVVPLTALTFRDEKLAASWWRQFRAEVVADARTAGLSQRRFSAGVRTILGFGAALATAGIVAAVVHYAHRQPPSTSSDDDPYGLIVPAIIFPFAIMMGFALRYVGERDTAAGRAAAAHWLGVKAWLRGHDAFADLPPSAVAVWDRYIGYGAALGASRVASTVIDMGMGNRRRVWSSYGGNWRRVRVSYPALWWRYGRPWGQLTGRSLLALAAGIGLIGWFRRGVSTVVGLDFTPHQVSDHATLIGRVGYAIGVVLAAYGAYLLVRVIVDALTPQTVTGQVLWKRVWRSSSGGEDRPAVPWLYYLAVDDGTSDRTRAWGLPADRAGSYDTGDTVTVTVRRWSRRVVASSLVEGATHATTASVDATGDTDALVAQLLAPAGGPSGRPTAGALLTADEVGAAIGVPVVFDPTKFPGPVSTTSFRTRDGQKPVLLLQLAHGGMVGLVYRNAAKGTELPGIGDGAWQRGNRAMARVGDEVVVLTLLGAGKGRGQGLPTLLQQAVARIPAQRSPR